MDADLEFLDASLPGTLPVYPGLYLAGRYVLTHVPPHQRGDGIKVVTLSDSRIALIVGDVAGAGTLASTTMARVLTILRDRLQAGESALDALEHVNQYAASAPVAQGATVAVVVLSLADGGLEYAAAGHPPPIIAAPSGTRDLMAEASRPLGMGGRAASGRGSLAAGEFLIMHTDGLLNAGASGVAAGQRLRRAAGEFARASTAGRDRTDDLCQDLLSAITRGDDIPDDVALLVAERAALPVSFKESVPATSEAAAPLVGRFTEWLDAIGAGLLDHLALQQAVSELTANVVGHAYADRSGPPGELALSAALHDDGLLQIDVRDHGVWQEPTREPGRGLILAGGLVDSMTMRRSPDGTTVTLRQALGQPLPVLQAGATSLGGPSTHPATMRSRVSDGRLVVSGAVEERCTDEFQDRVHQLTRAATADATIDVTEVTLLASSAIRILFDYAARSRASGVHLNVVASSGSIADRVLQLVDLEHQDA